MVVASLPSMRPVRLSVSQQLRGELAFIGGRVHFECVQAQCGRCAAVYRDIAAFTPYAEIAIEFVSHHQVPFTAQCQITGGDRCLVQCMQNLTGPHAFKIAACADAAFGTQELLDLDAWHCLALILN